MPELATGHSLSGILSVAARRLTEAGSDSPRLDAELLLAAALGLKRERLILDAPRRLDDPELEPFHDLLRRREEHEPVAYILGRREFRHVTLTVDPRVLIPRPETELLVEAGLELPAGARVLDLGTGSGAIALALAYERPDLELWGSDLSPGALEVARANGIRLGLEVTWVQADLLDGLAAGFDAVLANLPYVAEGAELPPEIERYEPAAALLAGPDGLEVIRRLAAQAEQIPMLALEIGFDQGPAAAELLHDAGFPSVEIRRDLAGHDRVVVARR